MVSGGEKRMMLSCVGFAMTPFYSIFREKSQASFFFAMNSIPMNRPLPRTYLIFEPVKMFLKAFNSFSPCLVEFSHIFSFTNTSNAVIMVAEARELPP
jgi:hypothetical protein